MKKVLAAVLVLSVCFSAHAKAEVIQVKGNKDWSVLKVVDGMTDKVSCVAVHAGSHAQVNPDGSLIMSMRGRGGAKSFTYRVDSEQASQRQEARYSKYVEVSANTLTGAKRLRLSVWTILEQSEDFDIDMTSLPTAMEVVYSGVCQS